MAQGALTSLAKLKTWLGGGGTPLSGAQDVLLGQLISSASAFVLNYLNRPYLASTLVSERYDGKGRDTLTVRHGPVTSVVSILYDAKTVTAPATGNPPSGGYLIDPGPNTAGRITLTDDVFCRGRLNVLVNYWAGYQQTEAQTAALSVQASRTWVTDVGVTYADGAPLVAVAAAPTVGQYAVSAGAYTFSAADVGASVVLTYGTVPYDVEQAVIELAAERYAYMGRIGYVTQTLAGQETTSFSQADMSAPIKAMLSSYRRLAPI